MPMSRTTFRPVRPAGAARTRLRRHLAAGFAAAALLLAAGGSALPLEAGLRTAATDKNFRSAKDAVRTGMRDYNAGDKEGALFALQYAADQGHTLALWKLGRMYAEGDGVPHDDLKAFEYFSKIADENTDDSVDTPNSGVVAAAFTSLGTYFLDGIKGTYVQSNPERAYEMFNYAASYFGDSNAQYNLARLYLDGNGVGQDPKRAARWFNLAAEKGHKQAQALLGDLLFNGVGMPPQPAKGLTWLALARQGADSKADAWIVALYDKAYAAASDGERAEALSKAQSSTGIRRRR